MKNFTIIVLIGLSLHNTVSGQFLTENQQDFISENAIDIEVSNTYQNGNWDSVIEKVKNKRLVLLGEFNHGSKEVFNSRNELIMSLHKRLGFNLILFESGIGEVGVINLMKNEIDSSALTSGFFGGWRTSQFERLLLYAKENDISVGGFDVQRTGSTFTDYLAGKLENANAFVELEKRFVAIKKRLANYRTEYDSVKEETEKIIAEYRIIMMALDTVDQLSIKTIDNRLTFLTYMLNFAKTKNWNERFWKRDSTMAENIKWLLDQYQPDQKAIIIAHNFHISRYNQKEEVMGEFLEGHFDNQMYVLGVFAKEGAFHNNSGQTKYLSLPDSTSLDIKHIIEADHSKMSFLDIPKTPVKGSKWLFSPIIVNDTFIDLSGTNKLILSKAFDGLLLLDSITAPSK